MNTLETVISVEEGIYKKKCSKLKKIIKRFVYENAALCDQVSQLQERVICLKEERNFLLKKSHTYESTAKLTANEPFESIPHATPVIEKQPKPANTAGHQKLLAIKRRAQELSWERMRPKKTAPVPIKKKSLTPVALDSTGVPSFPINLGSLSVYSLGEIVVDRPAFHNEDAIFPVGFCSTRVYGSVADPTKPTMYTCVILDGGTGPVFEISSDSSETDSSFTGDNINQVHSELLQRINMSLGTEVVNTKGRGADFFGISHPTVLNLLQSTAAAKKCANYVPTKFEINRSGDPYVEENDATLTFESLQRSISFSRNHMDNLPDDSEQDRMSSSKRGY